MTIRQNPRHSAKHAGKRRYKFGHDEEPVRHTDAWEQETFAEEQARWERSDPEYAGVCEAVREAQESGGEASRRAEEAKAEWDARVATQRHANDDAQKAQHALNARQTARRQTANSRAVPSPTTDESTPFEIESRDSPAPGIMPEPVRVHDQPATPRARAARRAAARATKSVPLPGHQNPIRVMLGKLLGVIRGDKYMVDAYPPAWHGDTTTRDGHGSVRRHRDGALRASAESAARPEPGEVRRAAPAELESKER